MIFFVQESPTYSASNYAQPLTFAILWIKIADSAKKFSFGNAF